MALASHLVDGGVVVKVLLVAGLWLAGWGCARLAAAVLPDAGVSGQFVAATLAIWNPYVAERLLQGHWSLLVGYGCLPWVAATMLRMRTPRTQERNQHRARKERNQHEEEQTGERNNSARRKLRSRHRCGRRSARWRSG